LLAYSVEKASSLLGTCHNSLVHYLDAAAAIATAHDLSIRSVKRILATAGVRRA